MSSGHGSSRRNSYGRRMKDLRTRRDVELEIDLEGPAAWTRGSSWDEDQTVHRPSPRIHPGSTGARTR